MATARYPTPVPGPDAFASNSRDARLSQAAVVLSIGASAAGEPDRVDSPDEIGLHTDVAALGRPELISVAEASAPLTGRGVRVGARIAPSSAVELMTRLADRPDPITAAALVESSLSSESRLVRTSAAVAALDTTGPRDEVLAQLVDGASRGGPLTRQIGRIGVARVDPQHKVLRSVVGRPSPLTGRDRPSHTAVLTHGTFAAMTRWWQPGGDFYGYLDSLTPALHLHDPSFRWSGLYTDGARQLAAQQLAAWVIDQNLTRPDLFAHSHGGTVACLATRRGLDIDRLVLLSWPVHGEWFPDFNRIGRIIDVRVKLDLVIIADRGGQSFTPPPQYAAKVSSHVNGWFKHEFTHEPAYWQQHGLAAVL
jgi:hypothetical protein